MSVSPHLDSPFLFPALPHVPYLLPPVPEVRGKPAHSAKREYGLHRRVLPLHRISMGGRVLQMQGVAPSGQLLEIWRK